MDIEELKQKSYLKVLFVGESGTGKTMNSAKVALKMLEAGADVLYLDTESEGSTTLLKVIDQEGYDDDVVENLEYELIDSLEQWYGAFDRSDDFDLMVIDTLDHKHSYVISSVTDAKRDGDADWNEYAQIYSEEKKLMEKIGKPKTNILATIDPASGKSNKPKGAQTNVFGYFTAVVQLVKNGDEWSNKIINWVGHSDRIGTKAADLPVNVSNSFKEYSGIDGEEE